MIPQTALALLLAWTNWGALNTSGTSIGVDRTGGVVPQIRTATPSTHLAGLVMRTASPKQRSADPKNAVTGYVLDRGIFTSWRFQGSTGPDTLTFGSQGVIISKRRGGVVDFGKDQAPDRFIFTNRIDVARCSEKHGIQCHPLNHLQRVVVRNFGPEDQIVLQGRVYRSSEVRNGALPGVPVERLRVE
jgi:hypothetical protein